MSGNIYIDSKLLNIESFKNCIKGLEGDFCNVQYISSPTERSVTDRFYKAISLVIRNTKHKSFYDYSLNEFQILAKADKEAFKQQIVLEKWDKIRVGKDTETKNKINFVQGIMAPEKKMNIQATLNFLDSFNTN
jgi:antirestriction protein ArdC